MDAYPDILAVGKLIADPSRVAMLVALLDGGLRPASDLAWIANVSRPAASAHLAKLVGGGLLEVVVSGKFRYYRLQNREVAKFLEFAASIAPAAQVRSLRTSRQLDALRFARICYDHLAGRLGVLLLQGFLEQHWLVERDGGYHVTEVGAGGFSALGVGAVEARRCRRRLAYPCADWSERRPHLAGALGAVVFRRLFELGWVEREPARRAVRLTDAGGEGLRNCLGLRVEL
ncbi:MAG: metalloregulator ArsR/SmtB family transcription factor [Thermaerobacter sp.]|nr:metalloregulator ArsR/SmtB family transcription factor [Thermaerobacter sp.]